MSEIPQEKETESEDGEDIGREVLENEVKESFLSMFSLAKKDKIPLTILKKMKRFFDRPKTPAAATAAFVAMYQAGGSVSRQGSYIAVNSSGRARRRKGVSKGAKKIPSGRPSAVETSVRGPPKKSRNLSQSVKNNVANAKSH